MKSDNSDSASPVPMLAVPAAPGAPLPGPLGELGRAAEAELLRQGESDNTLRSYRSALRYWSAWHALRAGRAITLPVDEDTVVQFIVDHAQRADADGQLVTELPAAVDQALVTGGYKGKLGPPAMNTLLHRVAVLSKVHQLREFDNPCAQVRIRELLAKVRRGYAKRGALPQKKPALTREPLEALLDTCDESLAGLRDRALLLVAFSSGGRRRSEVSAATMENTIKQGSNYVLTVAVSKGNQRGDDRAENDKPIVGRAAVALDVWLQAAGIRSGPIFRRVRRGGVVAEPLSPAAVRDIVKKRCVLAGLSEGFSAHSLRSGFVTEAGRQGVPLGETMALTGHRSTASLIGYFRQTIIDSKGARLMDGTEG